MTISIKEIKEKTCNHQYTNGRNAGNMCNNKVSLKDVQNNYTKCSLHYKKPIQRKFEKVLTKLVIYEDDKEHHSSVKNGQDEKEESHPPHSIQNEHHSSVPFEGQDDKEGKDFKKIQDDLINKLKIEKSKRQDMLKILLEYFNDDVIN